MLLLADRFGFEACCSVDFPLYDCIDVEFVQVIDDLLEIHRVEVLKMLNDYLFND